MIPLLIWYGIEPVVAADPAVGMQLAKVSKMPKVTGVHLSPALVG
jgi:hypothetical protein